jgi:hypothetical protein
MYSGAFFSSSCLILSSAGRRRFDAFSIFSDAAGCATTAVTACCG